MTNSVTQNRIAKLTAWCKHWLMMCAFWTNPLYLLTSGDCFSLYYLYWLTNSFLLISTLQILYSFCTGRNVSVHLSSRLASRSCSWRTRIQTTRKWSTKLVAKNVKKMPRTRRALLVYKKKLMCTSYLLGSRWLFFFFFCATPLLLFSSSLFRACVTHAEIELDSWWWNGTVHLIRSHTIYVDCLSSYHLAAALAHISVLPNEI